MSISCIHDAIHTHRKRHTYVAFWCRRIISFRIIRVVTLALSFALSFTLAFALREEKESGALAL